MEEQGLATFINSSIKKTNSKIISFNMAEINKIAKGEVFNTDDGAKIGTGEEIRYTLTRVK